MQNAECRIMQHLSNVMNHFWKRWRHEYLVKLRNSHRYATQNGTSRNLSVGDVVVVHDKDQPKEMWRIGKVLDRITGSDGCTRGAVVRVQGNGGHSTTLRRPLKRFYPLEIQCQVPVPELTKTDSR